MSSDRTVDQALQLVEEEGDGNPIVLLQDDEWRPTIARWKFEPAESGYKYGELDPQINWRAGTTMSKDDWENALSDAYDQTQAQSTKQRELEELTESEFQDTVDLNSLIDRQMAYKAYEWIESNMEVTAIDGEDQKGDVLVYNEGIWTEDGPSAVREKAIDLLGPQSSTNVSNELIDNHIKNRPETNVDPDRLGLDDGLVAVKNGLLDLEAGEIVRELKPSDYAITQVPWKYDPDAECPEWEQFISQSVEPGKEKTVQEYVGYCLHRGGYPWAKALMLLGDGRNGKTTFLTTVEKLLGSDENVMNADLSELAGGRFSAYRLEGKLANINADIEKDEITETSMFKNMTGGDAFQVEQKYGDPYDHKNSAKLIFASNSIPSVDTEAHAFYRRWLLVEFPHTFTSASADDGNPDADRELKQKIQNEMEGILAWAVRGYQRLVENNGEFTNSRTPTEVRKAWFSYSNPTERFCQEFLVEDSAEEHTPTARIYEAYERFINDQPTSPISQQQLTAYIKKAFENEGHYGVHKRRTDEGRESQRGFGSVHIKPMKR